MKRGIVFILALFFVFIVGREILMRQVTYIVSDDFHGFINVIENPDSVKRMTMSISGIQIKIPQSGRIEYRDIQVLRKWGIRSVKTESGETLPVKFPNVQEDGYGFWMMGVPAGERIYSFVGTRQEMADFVEKHEQRIYQSPPKEPLNIEQDGARNGE